MRSRRVVGVVCVGWVRGRGQKWEEGGGRLRIGDGRDVWGRKKRGGTSAAENKTQI